MAGGHDLGRARGEGVVRASGPEWALAAAMALAATWLALAAYSVALTR